MVHIFEENESIGGTYTVERFLGEGAFAEEGLQASRDFGG